MIKIKYNKAAFDNIIKNLEKVKEDISTRYIDLLLQECYNWFTNRANFYLNLTSIGYLVKAEIASSWNITTKPIKHGKKAVITNDTEKAVFVEFGVGMSGQANNHKNASAAGYKYNVPSDFKDQYGRWIFTTDSSQEGIDLQEGSYRIISENEEEGIIYVQTSGQGAVMYAYNALIDLLNYGLDEITKRLREQYGY